MGQRAGGEQEGIGGIQWLWHLVAITTVVFYKYHSRLVSSSALLELILKGGRRGFLVVSSKDAPAVQADTGDRGLNPGARVGRQRQTGGVVQVFTAT